MPTLFGGEQEDAGEEDFADEELKAAGADEKVLRAKAGGSVQNS